MTDQVDSLLIDVRASTQGFAQDVAAMRSSFDGTVVDGFSKAGTVLEKGLTSAIGKGNLGFDDLKRVALSTLNEIASQSLSSLFGGTSSATGTASAGLGGLLGSMLGLPGRATGGPVSPGGAYIVGERGPEVFVPSGAGRIDNGSSSGGPSPSRDVRVAINVTTPTALSAPQSLQRSSRQVAAAVRRALTTN
jgi:hypothetical protein